MADNYTGKLTELLQKKKFTGPQIQSVFEYLPQEGGYKNVCRVHFMYDNLEFESIGRSTDKEKRKDAKSRGSKGVLIKLIRHLRKENPGIEAKDYLLEEQDLIETIETKMSTNNRPDNKYSNTSNNRTNSDMLRNGAFFSDCSNNLSVQQGGDRNESNISSSNWRDCGKDRKSARGESGKTIQNLFNNRMNHVNSPINNMNRPMNLNNSRTPRGQTNATINQFNSTDNSSSNAFNSMRNIPTNSGQVNSTNLCARPPNAIDGFQARRKRDDLSDQLKTQVSNVSNIVKLDGFVTRRHQGTDEDDDSIDESKTFGELESRMNSGFKLTKIVRNRSDSSSSSDQSSVDEWIDYFEKNKDQAKKVLDLDVKEHGAKLLIQKLCQTLPKLKKKYVIDDNDNFYVVKATISFEDHVLHTFFERSKSSDDAVKRSAGKLLEAMRLQFS